jgi:hypothetical protein
LRRLLADEGLGAFILVLANASFEAGLWRDLQPRLALRFAAHAQACRAALAAGRALPDAADDLLVFLKLMALGLERLEVTQTRAAGWCEVQFNLLRAFRPQRMSGVRTVGARADFDSAAFHFNKPFLRKESIWSGELGGRTVDLLYNKFPFVELHGLLVPERERQLPQFLLADMHDDIWHLCAELAPALPGVGFAYNSYGAFASVNHLHFQMFVRAQPLPVCDPRWRHNGGALAYPAPCQVFDDMARGWRYLESLHAQQQPFNLLYLPGLMYCLPRQRQGDYQPAPWNAGYAWYEMAGGVVAFNRADYASLQASQIAAELARVGGVDDATTALP